MSSNDELSVLRTKYSAHLDTLKSIFPSWQDDDLLLVLDESKGSIDQAAANISEGHAVQFTTSKKKEKKVPTGPKASEGNFERGADGFRGRGGRGRGVADSFRGGRGSARGAFRGAPRGLPRSLGSANGHLPGMPTAPVPTPEASSSTPTAALGSKSSWADQVEESESSAAAATTPAPAEDSGDAGGWDLSPTPAVAAVEEKKPEEKKPATNGASAAAKGKAPVRSGVIPSGSKMSWAQIARPQEKPKPAPAPTPAPAAAAPTPTPAPIPSPPAPVAAEEPTPSPTYDAAPTDNQAPSGEDEAVTSAPQPPTHDTWGYIPSASAPVETPAEPEQTFEQPAEVAEPTYEQPAEEQQAPEPEAPQVQQEQYSQAPPPGFGALSNETSRAPASPAGRSAPVNRNASRFKQAGDQAVIMPGGAQDFGRVGMQFGSLSLGGDGEFNQEPEPSHAQEQYAPEPVQSAPEPIAAPEPTQYQPQAQQHVEPTPQIQAPSSNFFQQSQQTQQQQAPAPAVAAVSPQPLHQQQHHQYQQAAPAVEAQQSYSHPAAALSPQGAYFRQEALAPSPYYGQQQTQGAPPALAQPQHQQQPQEAHSQYASPFGNLGGNLGGYPNDFSNYGQQDRSGFYDPYSAFNQRAEQVEPTKTASTVSGAPSTGPPTPAQSQQGQPGATAPGYYGGMPPYNPYWAQTNPYYYGQTPGWAQQQQWGRPYPAQPPAPAPAPAASAASAAKPPVAQQPSGPYGHFSSSGYDEPASLGGYSGNQALSSQYGGIHSFLGGASSPQPQAQAQQAQRPGQTSPETSFKGYNAADNKTAQQPTGPSQGQQQQAPRAGASQPSYSGSYGQQQQSNRYPQQQQANSAAPPPTGYQGQQQQQQDPYNAYYSQQQQNQQRAGGYWQ